MSLFQSFYGTLALFDPQAAVMILPNVLMKVGESVYSKNSDRLTIYDDKERRRIRESGFPADL